MDWKDPESVDLNRVAERLHSLFVHHPPAGYLDGKTAMRNALEDSFGVSEMDAEELVDTLETRGFVHYEGDPTAPTEVDTYWSIDDRREE